MNVGQVGNALLFTPAGQSKPAASHGPKNLHRPKPSVETSSTESAPVSTNETDLAKGVLGLLQEGHFKGVADVRLRINFHDELSAIASDQFGHAAQDAVTHYLDSLDNSFGDFLGTLPVPDASRATDDPPVNNESTLAESITSIQTDFQLTVNDLQQTFVTNGGDANTFTSELKIEFETTRQSLTARLTVSVEEATPPAETTSADTDAPIDTEMTTSADDPPVERDLELLPGAEDFLTSLSESFNSFITTLQSAEAESGLPPLSEPSGNGSAYANF